jgi:hypothetical protein
MHIDKRERERQLWGEMRTIWVINANIPSYDTSFSEAVQK